MRRKWVAASAAALVFLAACGGAATTTPAPTSLEPTLAEPTIKPAPAQTTDPDATTTSAEDSSVSYGALVRRVFSDVADLTRVLSDVSIQLGSAPEVAPQAAALVRTTKDTFELVRGQLALAAPPPGYEELHKLLLESLSLYAKASAELLPDPETQLADYWSFQGLMQEGGKNFHAAGTEFDLLRP